MPKAKIKIGNKLENCDLKIISNPYLLPKIILQPISPCIHNNERINPVHTIKTSEILLKLSQSNITTTIAIKIIKYALDNSSLFTSTFGPSPNRIVATK